MFSYITETFLSGLLASGDLSRVSRQSLLSANDKIPENVSKETVDEGSNGVPDLQMGLIESHSTSSS